MVCDEHRKYIHLRLEPRYRLKGSKVKAVVNRQQTKTLKWKFKAQRIVAMMRYVLLAVCVFGAAAQKCESRSGTVEGGLCNGMTYDKKFCKDGGMSGGPFGGATVSVSDSAHQEFGHPCTTWVKPM